MSRNTKKVRRNNRIYRRYNIDYHKIVKHESDTTPLIVPVIPIIPVPQWLNQKDAFIKFSMYDESLTSVPESGTVYLSC